MSRIIRYLKCDKCETEYKDIHISFGHPDKDFIWKWECNKCNYVNEELIKAMPIPRVGILFRPWIDK